MGKLGPFEENTVVCGDCLEVMRQMPDGCVDLVYADMIWENLDFGWLIPCRRILKSTGSIYVQTDYRSAAQLKLALDELFTFRNWIVWCYKAIPTRNRWYQRKHSDILFYTVSNDYTWNEPIQPPSKLALERFRLDKNGKILNPTPAMARKGIHYVRNVVCKDWWDDIPVPSGFSPWDTGHKVHKWQKPIKLLERMIGASSSIDDLIFDPFMGSGTTAIAADRLGRRWFGCDIVPAYVEIAMERIAADREKRR